MRLFVKKHYGSAEAGFYTIFINAAVGVKGISAFIKRISYGAPNSNKQISIKPSQTVIVASEEDYDAIVTLLQRADVKLKPIGRVAVTNDAKNSLGNLDELIDLIKQYAIENIIFCINEFSAKKCIDIIQSLVQPVNYSFHFAGSSSIVSSNNKSVSGNVIGVN